MNELYRRILYAALPFLLCAAATSAAEIGLAGTDPTVRLPTNPPAFFFSVDQAGFYTSQYENVSGYTFLNLIVTGPATGITTVGCSPGAIFTGCSASIDSSANTVQFFFSGGSGIAPNESFFLTATNFVPSATLFGTSTQTALAATPEPTTIILTFIAVLGMLLSTRGRYLLKLRVPGK